jgi:hypothetical protein
MSASKQVLVIVRERHTEAVHTIESFCRWLSNRSGRSTLVAAWRWFPDRQISFEGAVDAFDTRSLMQEHQMHENHARFGRRRAFTPARMCGGPRKLRTAGPVVRSPRMGWPGSLPVRRTQYLDALPLRKWSAHSLNSLRAATMNSGRTR